jgi:hypothetical protein
MTQMTKVYVRMTDKFMSGWGLAAAKKRKHARALLRELGAE